MPINVQESVATLGQIESLAGKLKQEISDKTDASEMTVSFVPSGTGELVSGSSLSSLFSELAMQLIKLSNAISDATDQTARDAAAAAQTSANAAQTTANAAQTTANNALPVSGGTMTGNLVAYSNNRTGYNVRNIQVVTAAGAAVSTNAILAYRK